MTSITATLNSTMNRLWAGIILVLILGPAVTGQET